MSSPAASPHIPPLPPPPYTLRPTFTRPLSLLNPLDYLWLPYWVFFNSAQIYEYTRWCASDKADVTGWDALVRRDMIEVDGESRRVTVELVRQWLRRSAG